MDDAEKGCVCRFTFLVASVSVDAERCCGDQSPVFFFCQHALLYHGRAVKHGQGGSLRQVPESRAKSSRECSEKEEGRKTYAKESKVHTKSDKRERRKQGMYMHVRDKEK